MSEGSQKPPNPFAFAASGHPGKQFIEQEGMTLHDYFAAHAPITLEDAKKVHATRNDVNFDQVFHTLSQMRLAYADAMLRERSRRKP